MWPPRSGGSKRYKGHKVWIVGVDTAKDAIYSRLRIADAGPGYCHFPISYDHEFFKQLTSEKVKTRFVKGHPVREWHKPPGVRNEALDRRVYALAVLYSRGVPWERLAATAPTERPPEKRSSSLPISSSRTGDNPAARPAPAAAPRGSGRNVRFWIR